MENRIIYDWITFTTKIHSIENIVEILGLSDVSFISLERGMNGYPYCIYFGGISICYGAREEMGICCNMSGQGCRSWETYGNGDYKALFDLIIENYSEDSDKRQMNLTRLDVAYDDFEGLLDIDVIRREMEVSGYVKTVKKDRYGRDRVVKRLLQGNFVTRFSSYGLTVSTDGLSCYFGSTRSDVYIRIYDKMAEQESQDFDQWTRCEIQLRRGNAIGFIMLNGNLSDNYFGVLNNYLRFVVPDSNDTNKRRWATADWWAKFLESAERLSIFQRPGTQYDVSCLDGFVYVQCVGAIKTMIDLVGVDIFLKRVRESVKTRRLNPKYLDLLNRMGVSSDGILEYLRERGEAV